MRAVSRVYTNLAVLEVTEAGFRVRDLAPGVTMEHLRSVTAAPLLDPPAGAEG